MEDRNRGPEDPSSNDAETSRKKRRGTDFLSQYLLRRKERLVEHIKEEDSESDEKPKKFRRFFKSLFRNIVERPEGVTEKSQEQPSVLESLFETFRQEDSQNDEGNEAAPGLAPPETPQTYQSETNPLSKMSEWAVLGTEDLSQEEILEDNLTPQAEVPYNSTDDERQRTIPNIPLEASGMVEPSREEPPAGQEVVVERGAGMALPVALVGAEYLARKKADRKLDAKFTEKVARLEKDNRNAQTVNEELTHLVRQNREQLETLKHERGMQSEVPKVRVDRPERPGPVRPIERIESQSAPAAEAPSPTRERASKTTLEIPKKTETLKIMEQVAEAAEHDVPVERVFERSHEVKDDQTSSMGASSIGAIMADHALSSPAPSVSARTNSSTYLQGDNSGLPVISDDSQTRLYRQAMQSGFWAAIIIIVFGIIAYLVK